MNYSSTWRVPKPRGISYSCPVTGSRLGQTGQAVSPWHYIMHRPSFAEWLTITTGCHYFKDNVICVIIWQGLFSAAGIIHKGRIRPKSSCRVRRFDIPYNHCALGAWYVGYIISHLQALRTWRISKWHSFSISLCHICHMSSYLKIFYYSLSSPDHLFLTGTQARKRQRSCLCLTDPTISPSDRKVSLTQLPAFSHFSPQLFWF